MRRMAAVLATASGIALMVSVPAGVAAADDARCPNDHVCMYEDSNFGGALYVNQAYDGKKHEIDWWEGDNEISSVINNTGSSIKIYTGDEQSGKWHCVGPHSTRSNLKDNNFNDNAESWAFANC